MSTLYFSMSYTPKEVDEFVRYAETISDSVPLAFLVAYPYLKNFEKHRHKLNIRQWCMDSGAFSVFSSGKVIDLAEYTTVCKRVDACEVFGLDVIKDHVEGTKNLEYMWDQGVDAIPTYHPGEPWSVLEWAAKNANKIAIGSSAGMHDKRLGAACLEQLFARVYPKKIHGLAVTKRKTTLTYPFHSVDSTSWTLMPNGYGDWLVHGGGVTTQRMKTRSSSTLSLVSQIELWAQHEANLKQVWKKEMQRLDALPQVVRNTP